MTNDAAALLKAITQKPEEDGPRLAYADCLDEQETRYVQCPKCKGLKIGDVVRSNPGEALACGSGIYPAAVVVSVQPFALSSFQGDMLWTSTQSPGTVAATGDRYSWGAAHDRYKQDGYTPGDCPTCSGSGEVADTSARDRAEFIRVQVALHKFRAGELDYDRHTEALRSVGMATGSLSDRERALRDAHPEWSRLECPACANPETAIVPWVGDGAFYRAERVCETCGGSGDLFHEATAGAPQASRNPVFRRGFVASVECRLAECGEERTCPKCAGNAVVGRHWDPASDTMRGGKTCPACRGSGAEFTPSPWARAVVAAVPLAAFRVTDREPYHNGSGCCWFDVTRGAPNPNVPAAAELPTPLFESLDHPQRELFCRWKDYPTADAARAALGAALVRLVRG